MMNINVSGLNGTLDGLDEVLSHIGESVNSLMEIAREVQKFMDLISINKKTMLPYEYHRYKIKRYDAHKKKPIFQSFTKKRLPYMIRQY